MEREGCCGEMVEVEVQVRVVGGRMGEGDKVEGRREGEGWGEEGG